MVTLRPVDAENFWEIIDLAVKPEQAESVLPNAVSIGQAKVQPECLPFGVYAGETPVGFLMYCIDRDDGEWWLYRLMIDAKQQRRGYGRAALRLALAEMERDGTRAKVFLGVDPSGTEAVSLYESEGFRFNGQVFGKEHIMVKELRQ